MSKQCRQCKRHYFFWVELKLTFGEVVQICICSEKINHVSFHSGTRPFVPVASQLIWCPVRRQLLETRPDMLLFVLDFCLAINSMTAMHDFDLQKYELSPAEWGIAQELRDMLKVSVSPTPFDSWPLNNIWPDIQGCDTGFLLWHTKSCHHHPMDHINKTLATASASCIFSLPICAALVIGKNTVNWYYNKIVHSETYCITISSRY